MNWKQRQKDYKMQLMQSPVIFMDNQEQLQEKIQKLDQKLVLNKQLVPKKMMMM